MRRMTYGRSTISSLAAAVLLLAAVAASGLALDEEHPVVGRWVIEAEPGGAVWTFQPGGALVAMGPGEIISEGTWTPADGDGEFDAALEVMVSGQLLEVMGQVATDGSAIALYATATEAERPDDWTPWPAESRLLGYPLGMMGGDETPAPTAPPLECRRPSWSDGSVDWDRCDEGLTPA